MSDAHEIRWLDADALTLLAPDWAAAGPLSPFDGPELLTSWWSAFGDGRELRACTVLRAGAPVAVWPFVVDGPRLRAPANDHTPMIVPFAADAAARDALSGAVVGCGRELDLADVELTPSLGGALRRACAVHHARMVLTPASAAPYVDTSSGDFCAWRAATHPGWLKRIARYQRQMDRRHDLRLEVGARDGEVEGLMTAGLAAEASGWKGRAGTAIAQDPRAEAFYRGLVAAWSQTGDLRLSGLWLDGRVAAFDLGAERSGRYYSLKTGYDEAHRRMVPGLVLRLAILEHCFDAGLAAHDLLGERMDWKDKIATGTRDLRRVRIYPRRPAPIARWVWKAHVRPRVRDTRAAVRGRLSAASAGRRATP